MFLFYEKRVIEKSIIFSENRKTHQFFLQ